MSQDFVMRLIQQVAQMLASIMAHRKAGRLEEARQDVEKQCFRQTGLPFLLVKLSSSLELMEMMDSGPEGLRCIRKIMLAELLLEDALLDEAEGRFDQVQHSRELAAALLATSIDALSVDEAKVYREKLARLITGKAA